MKFASLGSGSKGNSTLVRAGDTLVMIDCGFSLRETRRRLARLQVDPGRLDTILVTHEHADHSSGVAALSRAYQIPVYLTHGTSGTGRCEGSHELRTFNCEESFTIGALSVKAVTGVPIKFIGVGEQLDKLELFHPDRMAQRILGHGDMATLIEKAATALDQEEMERQQQAMLEGKFTLDNFLQAMTQMKKLGPMKSIMKMIPGMGQMAGMLDEMDDLDPDKDVKRIEAMIQSMTLDERQNPDKIDRSRRNRIAGGSGTDPADVHDLLKQFKGMSGVMQNLAGMSKVDQFRAIQGMQQDMMNPSAGFQRKKERSKRGPIHRSDVRDKKKQQRKQAKEQRKKNKKRR